MINLKKNNANYNKPTIPKKNDSFIIDDNLSQFSEISDIQRNKTQNFSKLIASKNMQLIKSINFDELNNDFHNDNKKENKISEYDNNIKDSLMYNFNQINNNYIDQENTLSYEQFNRYHFNDNDRQGLHNRDNMPKRLYRNQSVHMPSKTYNKNIMNNINDSKININESINNIFYQAQQNISYPYGNNSINNNSNISINNMNNSINNSNNIYYPIQNINYNSQNISNNNISTNINNSINQNYNNNNINYNTQSIVPFMPGFNNNQFQNNNNFTNPNQFSQNDLTFLGGYAKTNNLKEDFIKINPNNPEIISELKEKVYYYHSLSNGNKLTNIISKGYIGINIKPPNIINNKEFYKFYINFISEKWKDHNYFIERDINKNIQQVTEMIYKIQLQKKQKAVKLITYSISKNIISKIKIIDTQINLYNNQLIYKFNFYQNSHKFVQRIEVIVEYKNNYQFWNTIKTEGNIINNNCQKLNVLYNKSINEGTIIFPNNCNIYPFIGKISIMVQLKNAIASNMNIKINYSNSTIQSQESLFCKKVSLLCFEYS